MAANSAKNADEIETLGTQFLGLVKRISKGGKVNCSGTLPPALCECHAIRGTGALYLEGSSPAKAGSSDLETLHRL